MKVLLITHRVPFPQNGGYAIVVCNTVKGLLDAGYQVSLFALNARKGHIHDDDQPDELISRINYKTHRLNINLNFFEGIVGVFNNRFRQIERFYNQGFERLLIDEFKVNDYDIVQFEGLYTMPYLSVVRRFSKAKIVYRSHNVEHQVWQRLAAQKGDPIKKWYLRLMASRIKNYEMQQINRVDAITVFTAPDQQTMQNYGVKPPVTILPISVDMTRYRPDDSKTEFPSLFFLGSLDWLPNREGIQWFLNTFYQDLTNGDLRVRFYVAGNDIPEEFDDYEVMGKIYIQGEVDNALEFVNSKSVMIVPLLSSGGMRVKIVEGMAMQKCIISTALGAEGIDYEDGLNILIANNREEFLKAIKRCISDEAYCKRIGENARKLAEGTYDISVVSGKLVAFYRHVTGTAV